ncbi:modification methylase CeqI [Shouchella sp. JSM 1781072]|uniref:response regulator aspartate phosphatase n=1 Tax=Bacillaceae TaxID=186817 RepID=UPI0020D07F53|nr:modification methylase CeqI [Alkalihalobacillus sp. LMS6]UTR05835.1 modification methylase CeqI [Alkalihalobacillus sp. LMS6]
MSPSVAAPEVGAKIVEWYSCIITYDREQAILLKHDVQRMMNRMNHDDKVIAYFELVNFRHELFIEADGEQKQFADLELADKATDEYMQFMYYFMYGQNEFHNGRYKSAVRSYKIAERLLEQVPDQIEKAEFYYRSAISYYRVDQYIFAVSYFEQALEIFEKNSEYEEIVLNIYIFLGGISTELYKFEEAENVLQNALKHANEYPVTKALLLRILGLNRVKQHQPDQAIYYFEEALKMNEHRQSVIGAKTEYNLINVKLKKEPSNKENHVRLEEIAEKVASLKMTEYIIRCKVSLGLYVLEDLEQVNKGLEELERQELYFEASELAEEVVDVYAEKGEFETALHYMRMAHRMRIHQSCIGVEQE